MKTIFILSIVAITICVVSFSCKSKTTDDELAERMAKSENFRSIVNYWKPLASKMKYIPDSTKKKLRALKPRIDAVMNNKSLNKFQRRDSIIYLTNLIKKENLFDSSIFKSLYNDTAKFAALYKNFYNEFPDYKKLPKEERTKVLRKQLL